MVLCSFSYVLLILLYSYTENTIYIFYILYILLILYIVYTVFTVPQPLRVTKWYCDVLIANLKTAAVVL